jgi:hypothetical protein
MPGEPGYASDTFYLTVIYAPPLNQSSGSCYLQLLDPIIIEGNQINNQCYGGLNGSLLVSVSGGTPPYAYHWNIPYSQSSPSGLPAGSYTLTVTDATFCTASASWVISQPPPIILNAFSTPVNCTGGSNGRIEVIPSGGTPPYSYSWSNGQSTRIIQNLGTGDYTVTVSDADQCQETGTWTISGSAGPCDNIDLRYRDFTAPGSFCFLATETITTAGDESFCIVRNGAVLNLIAKQRIIMMPGTKAEQGSKLQAFIGSDGYTCDSTGDALLAGMDGTTTNQPARPTSGQFSLYPNPAGDYVMADPGRSDWNNAGITVLNFQGTTVLSSTFSGNAPLRIPLEGLPAGLYLVKLEYNGQTAVKRLIRK